MRKIWCQVKSSQQHGSCEDYEKTVKDIAFIDPTRIVSGGFDRKILLLEIDKEGKLKLIDELKMNMQCRDMKTDGIIRDEERLILEGFKKKLVEIYGSDQKLELLIYFNIDFGERRQENRGRCVQKFKLLGDLWVRPECH